MKEAVPCQDAVKAPAERECSHIVDDPVLIGKTRFAEVDESWRRIHASHMAAFFDEVPGNRLGSTASKVEDGRSRLQKSQEAVEPRLFQKVASSFAVKTVGMPLIQAYDSLGWGVHVRTLTCSRNGRHRYHRELHPSESVHGERCGHAADLAGDVVAHHEADGVGSWPELERIAEAHAIRANRCQLCLGNGFREVLRRLTNFLTVFIVSQRCEVEIELVASGGIETETAGGHMSEERGFLLDSVGRDTQ